MNFVFHIGPLLRRPYAFPSVRSFVLGVPVFTAYNFRQSRLCGSTPVLLDLLFEKGYFLVSDVPFRNRKVERHQLRHPIGFQTMSSQIAATGIRKAINFGINGIHFRFCSDCHPRNRKWWDVCHLKQRECWRIRIYGSYCHYWWTKACTSWHNRYPMLINVFYIYPDSKFDGSIYTPSTHCSVQCKPS